MVSGSGYNVDRPSQGIPDEDFIKMKQDHAIASTEAHSRAIVRKKRINNLIQKIKDQNVKESPKKVGYKVTATRYNHLKSMASTMRDIGAEDDFRLRKTTGGNSWRNIGEKQSLGGI